MLASKYFDDLYYNNAYYARVGGISNAEVNHLEMEMLRMISFSLHVSPVVYENYRRHLYVQLQQFREEDEKQRQAAALATSVVTKIAHEDGATTPVDWTHPQVAAGAATHPKGPTSPNGVDAVLLVNAGGRADHCHSDVMLPMNQTAFVN